LTGLWRAESSAALKAHPKAVLTVVAKAVAKAENLVLGKAVVKAVQ